MARARNPEAFFYRLMAQCERRILTTALGDARWNRKRAARHLGISYRSLLAKIEQLQIEKPRFR